MARTLITALLVAFWASCAAPSFVRGTPKNAEHQYKVAMDDLESGLYPEALRGFSELKTKYPYSKFAALADLRTADTHFQRGKFPEAVDAFRNFLKYHPNHEEAAYAMLMIGEAYYEEIPEDWWFLPPAAEKDQAKTRMAISGYRDTIARFPQHEHTTKARERLKDCRSKLASHEIYVAEFYYERERYKAAASRAEGLLESYGGLGFDLEALYIAGTSRMNTDDPERARPSLERLVQEFPDTSEAGEAAELLKILGPSKAPTEPERGS